MSRLKMMAMTGVLAASMAASMLAGCGETDGTKPAITVNDETVTVGVANFLLRYQQAETTSMLAQYGLSSDTLWDQEYTASSSAGTTTYGIEFKNSVRDSIVQMVVLEQHADEYDVSISDEQQEKIDSAAKEIYDSNKDVMDKMGTTEDDIARALELETWQYIMRDPMTADVDTEVSDEEAAQSSITYARYSLSSYDSESQQTVDATDEEKAQYKEKLELLISQIQSNEDPAGCDISALADAIDSNITVTDYNYGDDDTTLPDEVKTALETLSDGETYDSVIETSDYYWVVRLDQKFDREATDSNKETIANQRISDAYDELLQEWTDSAEVTEESGWKDLEVTDTDSWTVKTVSSTSSDSSSESDSVTGTSAVSTSSEAETVSTSAE